MASQTGSDGVPLKKDGNPCVVYTYSLDFNADDNKHVLLVICSDMRYKAARDATGESPKLIG